MKTRTIITKVAGTSYDGRQDILAALTGDEPCRIVPEPENKYDPFALAVHVALHDGTVKHVGFIPKDLARVISPHLEGESVMASIREITGGFALPDGSTANYGLNILVEYPVDDDPPTREMPDDYDLPVGGL